MWIVLAFASAFFAGVTSILAKIGIKNTDSSVATAIRTVVVLIFSCLMVTVVGSQYSISQIDTKNWIFLILSGVATGLSWLCYFKALQLGDVNKVVPIDKSSTVLTMLLAIAFLGEQVTAFKVVSMVMLLVGTILMVEKKQDLNTNKSNSWILFAFGSAIFASLTAILSKAGITGVESNLGTAIRTVVVLLMAWIVVLAKGKQKEIKDIDKKSWTFILLSGVTTGLSWLCYYKALQDGQASIVVPIDKLSILVTVTFSFFVLKEKLSKKILFGLFLIVFGTILLLL